MVDLNLINIDMDLITVLDMCMCRRGKGKCR